MTRASNRFANEGEAMQISCPYTRVISWQSSAIDVLVLCEGDKPRINMLLDISNRLNISSDCTILTITNFTKKDAGTYVCFVTQTDLEKTVYLQHKIHVTLRSEYAFVLSLIYIKRYCQSTLYMFYIFFGLYSKIYDKKIIMNLIFNVLKRLINIVKKPLVCNIFRRVLPHFLFKGIYYS